MHTFARQFALRVDFQGLFQISQAGSGRGQGGQKKPRLLTIGSQGCGPFSPQSGRPAISMLERQSGLLKRIVRLLPFMAHWELVAPRHFRYGCNTKCRRQCH